MKPEIFKRLGVLQRILDLEVGYVTTLEWDESKRVNIKVRKAKKFKVIGEFEKECIKLKREGEKVYPILDLPLDFILEWLQKGKRKEAKTILEQKTLMGTTDRVVVSDKKSRIISG